MIKNQITIVRDLGLSKAREKEAKFIHKDLSLNLKVIKQAPVSRQLAKHKYYLVN